LPGGTFNGAGVKTVVLFFKCKAKQKSFNPKLMNSFKRLFLIVISITLLLTSCTLEKRVYMSGYHFEKNKTNHNYDRQELTGKFKENHSEKNQINKTAQLEIITEAIDESLNLELSESFSSVANSNEFIIPSDKKNKFYNSKTSTKITEDVIPTKTSSKLKREKKKKLYLQITEYNKFNLLTCIGFIFSLIFLFYVILAIEAILLIAVFGIFAILLSGLGLRKIAKNELLHEGKIFLWVEISKLLGIFGLILPIVIISRFLYLLMSAGFWPPFIIFILFLILFFTILSNI
jgi:hypothetical protein